MTIDDFDAGTPTDTSAGGRWRAKTPVVTPSGQFRVTLRTPKDSGPPDEEMFRRADALIEFALAHHREIFAQLHADYLLAAETEGYLKSLDVPDGLTQEQIGLYVGPVILFVRRSALGYLSGISCAPRWNEENRCDFIFNDGQLERIEY